MANLLFAIIASFLTRSQNYEKRLLASSRPIVRLSIRKEQAGSRWMDFD
jgi:hypothetical protein